MSVCLEEVAWRFLVSSECQFKLVQGASSKNKFWFLGPTVSTLWTGRTIFLTFLPSVSEVKTNVNARKWNEMKWNKMKWNEMSPLVESCYSVAYICSCCFVSPETCLDSSLSSALLWRVLSTNVFSMPWILSCLVWKIGASVVVVVGGVATCMSWMMASMSAVSISAYCLGLKPDCHQL